MMDGARGELVVYVGLGQSLLAQIPRLRPLGETVGYLDEDRALVFQASGDTRFVSDPMQDLPADALVSVYPHRRTDRSVPLTAASSEILTALAAQDCLLTVNLARRGAGIADFAREGGQASFRNLRRCLLRAAEIAESRRLYFRRLIVSWVQGQADVRTPGQSYTRQLLQIVDDIEALFAEVTAGQGKLLFCASQITATSPPGRRGATLPQLDAVAARPVSMILAGPEYMLERSDGVHLKPRSAVYLGKLHGRAIASRLRGQAWQPLHMASAGLSGSVVTVRFEGGTGALEAAAQTPAEGPVQIGVRTVPDLGFRWFEAGNPEAAIAHVAITGPREIAIHLMTAPAPGARCSLWLGFPPGIGRPEGFLRGDPALAGGGCTNLRTAGDGSSCLGLPIQDWAVQQSIAVSWPLEG